VRKLFWAMARVVVVSTALTILCLSALLFIARVIVRPAPGDWATTLRVGPLNMDVGVAALVQWGSTPWIAKQLHGRTLPTRLGEVHLAWDEVTQQLSLHCQPCTLRSSSWGGEPLRLQDVRMTVRSNATELRGTLKSGAVTATWHGTLRPTGITLYIDMPTTPVADGYALFASAISEVTTAQIYGTFAIKAKLELPSKALTVQPRLDGMAVQGLGTEAWARAQSQCGKGLPVAMAKAPLGTDSLLARAVLAAEDQRFYEHPGYDLMEMNQALRSNQVEDAPRAAPARCPNRWPSYWLLAQSVPPCASCANCFLRWRWSRHWAKPASCTCTWTTCPGAPRFAARRRLPTPTLANAPTSSQPHRQYGWLPCYTTLLWKPVTGEPPARSTRLAPNGWLATCAP
jgi:hypothetical protein